MTSNDADDEATGGREPLNEATGEDGSDRLPAQGVADALKDSADDDVLPASRRWRRLTGILALLIMAVILTFLVMFVVTHSEQSEGGTLGASAVRSELVGVA